jgi:hypothetical protein
MSLFSIYYIEAIKYIVILLSVLGLYYIFKRPKYAFYILLFTLPLKNFYIYIVTSMEVWKFLSLFFIMLYLYSWLMNISRKNDKFLAILLLLLAYVILTTVVNYFLIPEGAYNIITGGFFKAEGRPITQIIYFCILLSLILIPYYFLKEADVKTVLRTVLYSAILVSILGVVQFLIVQLTGINIFPIHAIDGTSHSGYLLQSIFRVNSIIGEPKHLAMFMVVAISILLFSDVNNVRLIKYKKISLFLFAFNLVFAFSTTGYALIMIVLLFYLYISNIRLILFLAPLMLIISFFLINFNESFIMQGVSAQTARIGLEIQDKSVLTYLKEEPLHAIIGTGLGNIHHYSSQYIPTGYPIFKDFPYKANSGLLFMMADYGLIGVFIFYYFVWSLLFKTYNLVYRLKGAKQFNERRAVVQLTFLMSIIFLFKYTEFLYIMLGITLLINQQLRVILNDKS